MLLFVFSNLGCEKDDIIEAQEPTIKQTHKPKYNTSVVYSNTINKNESLKAALNKLRGVKTEGKSNHSSKLILNDSLNIAIEDSSAKYLETPDGSYHSYTFVAFDYEHPQGMQNVVLSLQPDGTYREFLFRYNLTDSEIELYRNEAFVDLTGKISFAELDNNSFAGDFFSKETADGDCVVWDYTAGSSCTAGGEHSFSDGAKSTSNPGGCEAWGTTSMATPSSNNAVGIDWNCINSSGSGYTPPQNNNNPSNGPQSGAGQTNIPQQDVTSGYMPTPKQQRQKEFKNGLGDEAENCFNTVLTPSQQQEILDFLEATLAIDVNGNVATGSVDGYSQGDMDFAEQAALAMCGGGEVDYDENIIYDNSLNDYPCHKKIIKDAINSCSPLSQLVLNLFESNDGVNLIIKASDLGPINSGPNASTTPTSSYNSNTQTCDITITFNENYLENATDISIARTSIHESLHAILIYLFEQDLLYSPNGNIIEGFEGFVDAYINYQLGLPSNLNTAHHELLVIFVEDIAESLSFFSVEHGYNNYTFEYYKKMSWSGLTTMDSFLLLYPQYINPDDEINNPSNYNPAWLDIRFTARAEKYNGIQNFLHPNGTDYEFIPKGTAPNETEPCN